MTFNPNSSNRSILTFKTRLISMFSVEDLIVANQLRFYAAADRKTSATNFGNLIMGQSSSGNLMLIVEVPGNFRFITEILPIGLVRHSLSSFGTDELPFIHRCKVGLPHASKYFNRAITDQAVTGRLFDLKTWDLSSLLTTAINASGLDRKTAARCLRTLLVICNRLERNAEVMELVSKFEESFHSALLQFLLIGPKRARHYRLQIIRAWPISAALVARINNNQKAGLIASFKCAVGSGSKVLDCMTEYFEDGLGNPSKSQLRSINHFLSYDISKLSPTVYQLAVLASRLPDFARPKTFLEFRQIRLRLCNMGEVLAIIRSAIHLTPGTVVPAETLTRLQSKVLHTAGSSIARYLKSNKPPQNVNDRYSGPKDDWALARSALLLFFSRCGSGLPQVLRNYAALRPAKHYELAVAMSLAWQGRDTQMARSALYRKALKEKACAVWNDLGIELRGHSPQVPDAVIRQGISYEISLKVLNTESEIAAVGKELLNCLATSSAAYEVDVIRGKSVLIQIGSKPGDISVAEFGLAEYQSCGVVVQHKSAKNADPSPEHEKIAETLLHNLNKYFWMNQEMQHGLLVLAQPFSKTELEAMKFDALKSVAKDYQLID